MTALAKNRPNWFVADIPLGHKLDGHEGVVHGGVLAMLFDDAMGMAFGAMGVTMALTANLSVDYECV
jgi:acyl-coenzyme A thioesterase PaaI-like protein